MVYRVYVEKKSAFALEASALLGELRDILGIASLESLRVVNRYDVEDISPELFEKAVRTVFSEPQIDDTYSALRTAPGMTVFAVEYLPGQFDQRANSAAECIQLISCGMRPDVKTAKIYIMTGDISSGDLDKIKKYIINPVEAREASLELFTTLKTVYDIPTEVDVLTGFDEMTDEELDEFRVSNGLAMDDADLAMCRDYFASLHRDPTITEIKVIDTYWSDHCRHTTFNTIIDDAVIEDDEVRAAFEDYKRQKAKAGSTKPVTLMGIGTIAVKMLRSKGLLDKLDSSEEINACTVKIDVEIDGKPEKWLLLFKNETHNHPTEIEPFGGAATCIGGAIRDPLSGRSYVYAAMRVTGAADPLKPVDETIPGKLPQRKIVTGAAAGYSSYGNQIGLATGIVDEVYHPGYVAKRMEIGAVIAATPQEFVRRERPVPGDVVILLGGRTGRDGIGGATGASKAHNAESLETCGAEVQKGNAPEERKLQRLFRNHEAAKMIKRCNDFGAGGVSVAIGELADGLEVDLNKVTKKYEGLDGTELAISESQERMAVVVAPEDAGRFCEIAESENLEATVVAKVTEEPFLKLNWNGRPIVNISREFLDTDGAEKHITVEVPKHAGFAKTHPAGFSAAYFDLASDLNVCSKRGLSERFDSTIGAGTVLMPFGGIRQRTPVQAMVHLISSEEGHTDTCSFMSWGFNPMISSASPYHGAYLAVIESVSKLIAHGASLDDTYLTVQEYFEKPGREGKRWGKPFAAVLGAFEAEKELGIAAIGGKDSMSGTFEDIDVPPTLVSFAVTTGRAGDVISPEFKAAGHRVILVSPRRDANGLPDGESLKAVYSIVNRLVRDKKAVSCYTPGYGGIAEAVLKMALGNAVGFSYGEEVQTDELFGYSYGSLVIELSENEVNVEKSTLYTVSELGVTTEKYVISKGTETINIDDLENAYEDRLEPIYKCNIRTSDIDMMPYTYETDEILLAPARVAKPKVLIPVFPGTNCEYDSAKAFRDAGAEPEVFVINNLTPEKVAGSVEKFASLVRGSQIIFIPGGFSGGDEPDGSGKLITAFFRNDEIKEAVTDLLDERGGLMAGICNGFQALIKLGLVPYGKILDTEETFPTLTFNEIGRHQSKLVRIRVASNRSPWMMNTSPGEIYTVPISHGEGRFIASEKQIEQLSENGQILTQYVDLAGDVSGNVAFNPNGSYHAIEGITSPDGRVLGKMGHTERTGKYLYKNVPGRFDMKMFESAVEYFTTPD